MLARVMARLRLLAIKNKQMIAVVYGEATLDGNSFHRLFSEGREYLNALKRDGCPNRSSTDKNNEEVKKQVLAKHRITIRSFY